MFNQKDIKVKENHIILNEKEDIKVNKNKVDNNYVIEYFFDENGIDYEEYIEMKCTEIIKNFKRKKQD